MPQFSNDAITILGFYCNAEPLSTEMFSGYNPNGRRGTPTEK
jgi:hypothetical protein